LEFFSTFAFQHFGRIGTEVAAGFLPSFADELFAANDTLALLTAHAVHDNLHGFIWALETAQKAFFAPPE